MDKPKVLSYYFPNYHPGDRRNEIVHGQGWSEWELVRAARPRFDGHRQPMVPLWGCEDESDPVVMARKIDVAAAHGIDAFIFDWYWYDDGPFLERCLENGFLGADNVGNVRFCCMWANHDWHDIHPIRRREASSLVGGAGPTLLHPGRVSPGAFRIGTQHCIDRYFRHPSHFLVSGRPYFSFYDLGKLVESFGSVSAARSALDDFRARTTTAGFPGLHLNAVVWGQPILPGETKPTHAWTLAADLGFDSTTGYVWIHHGCLLDRPSTSYAHARDAYLSWWDATAHAFRLPYFPNVTVGWDSTPRCIGSDTWNPGLRYPYTSVLVDNTPEEFGRAIQLIREQNRRLAGPEIYTVNCWNEWTEGSCLEPESVHGLGYLQALREAMAMR